ncbi:alpha-hydroxy-acid oxidizing protein, partial [uncultured Maricaulis sp.]|uniref:alpha-hydroxy-acid oxidizing protein n=1 Tax=uncultured Maricaulis sp. TaxID=174710 RepID=UPI0030D9DF2E
MTAIDQAHNIEALRALARKRLPRMVFDYIDGGSDDEITLGRNDRRYGDYELNFKFLVDISYINPETRFMGARSRAAIIVPQ